MKKVIFAVVLGLGLAALFNNCAPGFQNGEQNQAAQSAPCAPNQSMGAPQNIEQVVNLVNSLPKPVSIPCLVASLERPLKVQASASTSSAQPASGSESPRLFIFSGPLVMSVAPIGIGAQVAEFGVIKSMGRTLKGEMHFPVYSSMSYAAPYDRIRSGSGTTCIGCHASEARDSSITFTQAFVSDSVRPAYFTRVSLSDVKSEREKCGTTRNQRCDLLRAIFDHGPVEDTDFPSDIP